VPANLQNHRQALDLIYERVGSPASPVLAEVATVLGEDQRWHVVWQPGHLVDFAPVAWREWLPPIGEDYDDKRDSIIFRFELLDGRLAFYVRLQSTVEVPLRKQLAEFLTVEAPKFGFKRKQGGKVTGKRTTLTGRERVLEWGEDDLPESETIRRAVKSTLDDLFERLEKLALVLKPMCKLPTSSGN
jgi:hypothetical protein